MAQRDDLTADAPNNGRIKANATLAGLYCHVWPHHSWDITMGKWTLLSFLSCTMNHTEITNLLRPPLAYFNVTQFPRSSHVFICDFINNQSITPGTYVRGANLQVWQLYKLPEKGGYGSLCSIDFDASHSRRTRSRGCRPFAIDRGTAIGIVTLAEDR